MSDRFFFSFFFHSILPPRIRNCCLASSLCAFTFINTAWLCWEFFSTFIPLEKYVSADLITVSGLEQVWIVVEQQRRKVVKKNNSAQNKPWTLFVFYTQWKEVETGKNNSLNTLFWKVKNMWVEKLKSPLFSLQNQRNFRMAIHFAKLFFHYLNQVRTKCSILDKTHVNHCSNV